MGMNRSATTAAIFMALHGFADSFDAALRIMQRSRGVISPMKVFRNMGNAFVAHVRSQQQAKAQARRLAAAAAGSATGESSATAGKASAAERPAEL